MTEEEKEKAKAEGEESKPEFATEEKQRARAFLRERFLRVVTGIVGKQAEFHMYENTRVSGEFRGCDVDCLEVFVRNLQTPLGKIPEAILRSNDVIHFDVNDVKVDA
ncbi:hypothetical protein KM043_007485 [Ampulex compressa]|nr:hypothetical protein KM043_007485 [Ampulex compressa]